MKKEKALMKLLKVTTISYLLMKTNQGELTKSLRLNDEDYHYTLDSVELDKETVAELFKLL